MELQRPHYVGDPVKHCAMEKRQHVIIYNTMRSIYVEAKRTITLFTMFRTKIQV